MQSVNSGMTKRVLTDILASDFGVEAPSNSTKDAILKLLEEAGCPVTTDETSDNNDETVNTDKEPRYVINIFKQKGEKGAVTGCINGEAFALPRGVEIEVSQAIYLILTKGAIKMIGEPLKDGGVEMYSEQAYPLTLVKIIN